MALVRTVPVTVHGRYLVEAPDAAEGAPLLVGFHGYAEPADAQLERMRAIPGSNRWVLVAVQGLHRFYRGRSRDVVASWMTREDRELAIADNAAFVAAVVDEVVREWQGGQVLVFAGFSQGASMAFRAACSSSRPVRGVMTTGGDVPPELDAAALARPMSILLGRGRHDEWYTAETFGADTARLRAAGLGVQALELDSAHEWPREFSEAAGRFLSALVG
jgi:predicted esterase